MLMTLIQLEGCGNATFDVQAWTPALLSTRAAAQGPIQIASYHITIFDIQAWMPAFYGALRRLLAAARAALRPPTSLAEVGLASVKQCALFN